MTAERPDPSPADETLARHVAFAEVLQGERPMEWSDWAIPIYDSQCLTPPGLQVALWAMETLQRFLGAEFLRRPTAVLTLNKLGLWPANGLRKPVSICSSTQPSRSPQHAPACEVLL